MKTEILSLAHGPDRSAVKDAKTDGRYVYIGRIHYLRPKEQRDWGNRAPNGKVDTTLPDQMTEHLRAVNAFRKWIKSEPSLLQHMHELKGKALVCHCKGLPCHGQVLKELAETPPKKRGRPVTPQGQFQKQQAKEMGVSLRTIQRWEKDREEIAFDPILSEMGRTLEGFKEAKAEIKARRKAKENASINAAKAMLIGLKKWEYLNKSDAYITRSILMEAGILDRIIALIDTQ